MTNHPNRSRTYWYYSPRGFANEYTVGIARTHEAAVLYEMKGFERISREQALRDLTNRGDNATQVFARVTVDYREISMDRFELARDIKLGRTINNIY